MITKNILFLCRQTPYGDYRAAPAIESVLVMAAFDQRISVLFRDDGVWQLLKDQNRNHEKRKTISKMLGVFAEYEIQDVYACRNSLSIRNVSEDQILDFATIINSEEQKNLIKRQNIVLND